MYTFKDFLGEHAVDFGEFNGQVINAYRTMYTANRVAIAFDIVTRHSAIVRFSLRTGDSPEETATKIKDAEDDIEAKNKISP